MELYSVDKLIAEARRLAADYRRATGKSLGLGSEIARHDAAQLLGLELVPETEGLGYDAVGTGRWAGRRVQIKGRAIFDEGRSGQRIGQLNRNQPWDAVILVLMNEDFEPYEMYEALREELIEAMGASASRRASRGALSVAKFKIIGRLVWTRESGLEDGELWDNGPAASNS